MTINSSPTNTMLSTSTADIHEKLSDTIGKEYVNNSKMIKIKLQIFLLIMMINNLKHTNKSRCYITRFPIIYRNNTNTNIVQEKLAQASEKNFLRQENIFQKYGKSARAAYCTKSRVLTKVIANILDIDLFEQKCVIIKWLLLSELLKQHIVIIGVDKSLSNSALHEHRCLENIKKYTNWLAT